MNFSLTPQLEQFVRDCASTGEYNNASEVVREALRLFMRTEEARQLKLKNLRLAIQQGEDAIQNGEFTMISTDESMDEFLSYFKPGEYTLKVSKPAKSVLKNMASYALKEWGIK